jgi:hypothetical protein
LDKNPGLTYYERVRRRLILQEVAMALKLPMSRNTAELNQLIDGINLHQQSIDEYFGSESIQLYDDYYGITGHDQILMPPDVYDKVKRQLINNYKLCQQILDKHNYINDDIKFDNDSYITLKNLLLTVAKHESST